MLAELTYYNTHILKLALLGIPICSVYVGVQAGVNLVDKAIHPKEWALNHICPFLCE